MSYVILEYRRWRCDLSECGITVTTLGTTSGDGYGLPPGWVYLIGNDLEGKWRQFCSHDHAERVAIGQFRFLAGAVDAQVVADAE